MNVQTGNFAADPKPQIYNGQECEINFSFYGLRCRLSFDDPNLSEKLLLSLPPYYELAEFENAEHIFRLVTKTGGENSGLYWNNERILQFREFDETIFEAIESKIQFSMATALPPKMYFLHAGAVALNNIGIIIPGDSFSGKTTLTREFLKAGAEYFSDDCAIIDKYGRLYPYSKTLSIRNGFQEGEIVRAESLGANTAREPAEVKLIILTKYKKGCIWKSQKIGQGKTVWELSKHLFYPTSMTLYPGETLQALANIANQSKTLYGRRGEAAEVIKGVLADFEEIIKNKESNDVAGK